MVRANRPKAKGGKREYHIGTKKGEIARLCLLVGSPARATLIAKMFFHDARQVGDDHRGLRSFTGTWNGVEMSVVTTGMGGASTGIVLPEAVRSGARCFIRVGSCGTLWPHPKVGDSAICTSAVRLEGASKNWAPIEYPAVADYRVVSALVAAANWLHLPYHIGIGATTDCFVEGQARSDDMSLVLSEGQTSSDDTDYIPPRLQAQHDELQRRGVLFYSMEEAAIFVWCSTHGGIPAGAVDAIYAQRVTNKFKAVGDENAAKIALQALYALNGKL